MIDMPTEYLFKGWYLNDTTGEDEIEPDSMAINDFVSDRGTDQDEVEQTMAVMD